MPKYIDERIRARELFVHLGCSYLEITKQLPVSPATVRRWSTLENWTEQRKQVITDPVAIGERMKSLIVKLIDDIESKINSKQHVGDTLIDRLGKYCKLLAAMDGQHDTRSSALFAMKAFTAYLYANGESAMIKEMHRLLPDYYRSIINE